jgi:hypothetical protein
VNDRGWGFAGTYSRTEHFLRVNYGDRGLHVAIQTRNVEPLVEFALHEFSHHFESNHLAEGFHAACCRLGAKLAVLAVNDPAVLALLEQTHVPFL